jgi:predicted regulator of Ras-like GTPase activity (Roadblock/LC7/MglB family)
MKSLDSIGFVGAEDVRQLDALLASYQRDTLARLVVLADRSGRLLTSVGELGEIDPTTYASLVAGDFAASGQLAAQVGEAEFASLYHKGPDRSMFLADVGGAAILAVLFDDRTTLGMVRVKAKSLVPRAAAVFEQLRTRGPLGELVQFEAGWAAAAESEIDRVFRDE